MLTTTPPSATSTYLHQPVPNGNYGIRGDETGNEPLSCNFSADYLNFVILTWFWEFGENILN